MFPRDPEPYEGDYWDGYDEANGKAKPEAGTIDDDWEPRTCHRCGSVVDDWDRRCEECGAPLGWYAIYREADLEQVSPEKAGF